MLPLRTRQPASAAVVLIPFCNDYAYCLCSGEKIEYSVSVLRWSQVSTRRKGALMHNRFCLEEHARSSPLHDCVGPHLTRVGLESIFQIYNRIITLSVLLSGIPRCGRPRWINNQLGRFRRRVPVQNHAALTCWRRYNEQTFRSRWHLATNAASSVLCVPFPQCRSPGDRGKVRRRKKQAGSRTSRQVFVSTNNTARVRPRTTVPFPSNVLHRALHSWKSNRERRGRTLATPCGNLSMTPLTGSYPATHPRVVFAECCH
ncbi:hypothetical protein EDC04DRAFT_419953 [Pisolithus marmoratus]|nr:hypothetical protein EDC04DRAFT_419953 [Pisolithus marmoratus]